MPLSRLFAGGEGSIQELLNELEQEMQDSNSAIYMPRLIFSQTSPVMDPFSAGDWNMNTITGPGGQTAATNVCGGTNPDPLNNDFIPVPGQLPSLQLSQVQVVGLANVKLTQLQSSGPDGLTVNASAVFSQLSGSVDGHTLAPQIQITGRFQLAQQCCTTTFGGTQCTGSAQNEVGTGSFTATLGGASGSATFQMAIQMDQAQRVAFTATAMGFTPNMSQLTVSVKIDDIPDQQSWDKVANEVMNSPTVQQYMVDQINSVIGQPSALQQLSDVIGPRVNQYLQSNHEYPYDTNLALKSH